MLNGYSSSSAQQEPSIEYQHDRVYMVFKDLCIPVLWKKVASALEELKVGSCGVGYLGDAPPTNRQIAGHAAGEKW